MMEQFIDPQILVQLGPASQLNNTGHQYVAIMLDTEWVHVTQMLRVVVLVVFIYLGIMVEIGVHTDPQKFTIQSV